MARSHFPEVSKILAQAGEKLRTNFGKTPVLNQKSSWGFDIVTKLDLETEQFIAKALLKRQKNFCFITEA